MDVLVCVREEKKKRVKFSIDIPDIPDIFSLHFPPALISPAVIKEVQQIV